MNYWLVKSDPKNYSWEDLVKDGSTFWDGVRNYQARNFMKDMKMGDEIFVYHSQEGLSIMGTAKVIKEFYQDPTIDDDRWVAFDLEAIGPLNSPVHLDTLKAHDKLQNLLLIRNSRLSVMPMTKEEHDVIMDLAG